MVNTCQIQMNVIGYNEKGFIGFMTGGSYLSYLETPKNADELIEKMHLPYISHENVKETNKEIEKRKKESEKKSKRRK